MTKLETQDDWTPLREAADDAQCYFEDEDDPATKGDAWWWWNRHGEAIAKYIPKLLDSYAELWELAESMMGAWLEYQAAKAQEIKPATMEELTRAVSAEDARQKARTGPL